MQSLSCKATVDSALLLSRPHAALREPTSSPFPYRLCGKGPKSKLPTPESSSPRGLVSWEVSSRGNTEPLPLRRQIFASGDLGPLRLTGSQERSRLRI